MALCESGAFMEIFPITLKKGADEQQRLGVNACT